MGMVKTQVYLPADELRALHRVARARKRRVADLVRDAVRTVWLQPVPAGPVALWEGPFAGSSVQHDAAFDDAWPPRRIAAARRRAKRGA